MGTSSVNYTPFRQVSYPSWHFGLRQQTNQAENITLLAEVTNPACYLTYIFCLGYDMSTFIRRYGRYLNEKAFAYRQMAFDFTRVKKGYVNHGGPRVGGHRPFFLMPTLCMLTLWAISYCSCHPCEHLTLCCILLVLRAWWGPWPLRSCWKACLFCRLRLTHSWSSMWVPIRLDTCTCSTALSSNTRQRISKVFQSSHVLFSQIHPKELNNGIINGAFLLLFKDLVKLFASYNDGVINLLGP